MDITFAGAVVTTFDRIIEQAMNAIAIILVVLRRIDTALCSNAVCAARAIVKGETFDVVSQFTERGSCRCTGEACADHDDFETPVVRTATWGYARLHRTDSDDAAITGWRERLEGLGAEELYVFFKHDEGAGSGPTAAEAFTRAAAV